MATDDFPQPAGPVMMKMCRYDGRGAGRECTLPIERRDAEDVEGATRLPTDSYLVTIVDVCGGGMVRQPGG